MATEVVFEEPDLDGSRYKVGDLVLLTQDREGEIKYVGKVDGLNPDTDYYGIELTDGQSAGDNSGSYNDQSYFQCEENRGLFLATDSDEIRRKMRDKDYDNPRRRRNQSMKSLNELSKEKNDIDLTEQPLSDDGDEKQEDIDADNVLSPIDINDTNTPATPADSNTVTPSYGSNVASPLKPSLPNLGSNVGNGSNSNKIRASTPSGRAFQEDFDKQMSLMTEEQIISICPFILVGRGVAGIDEMRTYMDDSKIYFGMLQIQIGEGQFARFKNIFIHFNGEKHPKPLQRAKINRQLPKAKEVIGHCHAPLVVTSQDIFQVDWVFNSVKGIFVEDNINTGKKGPSRKVDLNTLKNDYKSLMEKAALEAEAARRRLEEERQKMAEELRLKAQQEEEARLARIAEEEEKKRKALEEAERLKKEAELAEKRRIKEERDKKRREAEAAKAAKAAAGGGNSGNTLEPTNSNGPTKKKKKKRRRKKKKKDDWSDERPWTPERVLSAVHAEFSPFNWAIFEPNNGKKALKCLHWGHGSIAAIREKLSEDSVNYGIMRLSFGSGKFKRSHFVFFLWTPDAMTTNSSNNNSRSKKNKERMKHVSWQPQMQKLLSPFNVTVVAESLEKVTNSEWINRIKKTVVVDGGEDLSEEAMRKALEEEEAWLAELRKKQEEEQKKRRELEEKEREEYAANQRDRVLKQKEKAAADASEITDATSKLKQKKEKRKISNLDVSDVEDDDKYDSEYYTDVTASEMEDDSDYPPEEEEDDIDLNEPIVVQLSEEELERLAEERRLAEIEERKKQAERAKILEEAMHSKLCLESVELVKRESEHMCWVLIEPRIEPPKPRK